MRRNVTYKWHLRELMAAHGLTKTTELIPLLRERGVNLSATQVYRLAAETPERLSLHTLAALCDIFDCAPGDLVETFGAPAGRREAASGGTVSELRPGPVRPRRARIIDDGA